MMNVIKTAIITIIISIISGLLLEHFKNLAPRILCKIGKGVPIEINNKKVYTYVITVSNLSKKIIHDLTLNIQSSQSNLKIADAKITKGLKFYSSIKDDIVDIDIPFLSKDDKFSVTVYVENQCGFVNQPVIVMRSPENFKKVDSIENKGILSSSSVDKFHKNKKTMGNKKAIITVSSIALFIAVGVLVKVCFKGAFINAKIPNVKASVSNQSNGATGSPKSEKTKNTDAKTQTDGTTGNTDKNTSTGETTKDTDKKSSTENKDEKPSTGGPTKSTDSSAPIGGTNENTDSNAPTGGSTENIDEKPSTGGTTENIDSNAPTGGSTENTDGKSSPTGGTNENTDEKSSTGESNGNINEKAATDGTSGNTGK